MQVKGQHIECDEHDEGFLRRLGGALIVQWDSVPDDLKPVLIEQAADMVDRQVLTQAAFQIEEFIGEHKGGD